VTLSRAALKEVRDAEDRDHGERALGQFVKDYEAKATEKVTKDREELVAFYAFPAELWAST
jgi:transposase-like protein